MRAVHPAASGIWNSPRLSRTAKRGSSPSRIDLHGASHAGRQYHAFRHLIDVDAHRNALGQPHPGEDRIDVGKALAVGLGIRDVDAARDAADMTPDGLWVAHQLDAGVVTFADPSYAGLFEIAVDPERVGVDQRDD